jgi:hypothetical protein
MKTGFSNDTILQTGDKTIFVALADALVQEIIKIVTKVSDHNPSIAVVNEYLMLKCIKYAILDPGGIGAKMNQLLDYVYLDENEDKDPPSEISELASTVQQTYGKHYNRLETMEKKHQQDLINSGDQPSYMRPTTHENVTKPLVRQMLGDYFETPLEEGEEEEGEEGEEEEGEEGEEEGEEDIESQTMSVLVCKCDMCNGVMRVGEIREFYPELEKNPFIKAIFSSLTKLENKFGR